jgi:hypothetical protein
MNISAFIIFSFLTLDEKSIAIYSAIHADSSAATQSIQHDRPEIPASGRSLILQAVNASSVVCDAF